MSTQINHYVILGVKLDYQEFKEKCAPDDAFETVEEYCDSAFKGIHHHNGLCCLYDGRSGKYVIIGEVIAKTTNHDDFSEPVCVDFKEYYKRSFDISKKLFEEFQVKGEVQLITVSHYR